MKQSKIDNIFQKSPAKQDMRPNQGKPSLLNPQQETKIPYPKPEINSQMQSRWNSPQLYPGHPMNKTAPSSREIASAVFHPVRLQSPALQQPKASLLGSGVEIDLTKTSELTLKRLASQKKLNEKERELHKELMIKANQGSNSSNEISVNELEAAISNSSLSDSSSVGEVQEVRNTSKYEQMFQRFDDKNNPKQQHSSFFKQRPDVQRPSEQTIFSPHERQQQQNQRAVQERQREVQRRNENGRRLLMQARSNLYGKPSNPQPILGYGAGLGPQSLAQQKASGPQISKIDISGTKKITKKAAEESLGNLSQKPSPYFPPSKIVHKGLNDGKSILSCNDPEYRPVKQQKREDSWKEKARKEMREVEKEEEKKRQEKNKQQRRALYDEFIGIEVKKDEKTQKSGFLNLLAANDEMSQERIQTELSEAERAQVIKEQARQKEIHEYNKKERYKQRMNVDDLISHIVSGELIFLGHKSDRLESVPPFFEEGHNQYMKIWEPLFFQEIRAMILSRKKEDTQPNNSQIKKRETHWRVDLQMVSSDSRFQMVKLQEIQKIFPKNSTPLYQESQQTKLALVDQLKEFDLLILSFEELPKIDIKGWVTDELLYRYLREKRIILGVVYKSNRAQGHVQVRIDQNSSRVLSEKTSIGQYIRLDCYFLESLSTSMREYRSLRCLEFFDHAPIIYDPVGILADTEFWNEQPLHQNSGIMLNFVDKFSSNFNQSQTKALQRVAEMKHAEILLIQGPPGTGKTHTIHGIISMLMSCGVKKILICAPSNAAIDEIVGRIMKKGLYSNYTEQQIQKMVLRIGALDYDPIGQVKDCTLDTKIFQYLRQNQDLPKNPQIQEYKNRLNAVDELIELIQSPKNPSFVIELNRVYTTEEKRVKFLKMDKEHRLGALKGFKSKILQKISESRVTNQSTKEKQQFMEYQIIQESTIICTTLSSSMIGKLESIPRGTFEYLIIDEACQSVELQALIPFEHAPSRVIMVGDHQQLPATVLQEKGEITQYSRSLFERFLSNQVPKFMLSIQYRMHPLIRRFPSEEFYRGELQDDAQIETRELPKYLQKLDHLHNRVTLLDLGYAKEDSNETSKFNKEEAELAYKLFDTIVSNISSSDRNRALRTISGRVGIITPYKSQVRVLKDIFGSQLRKSGFNLDTVEINTVDAFQGREKDIIIISCVRGSKERNIGFLHDYRRMNVAITRAKFFLFVIGNSSTLSINHHWNNFINYCRVIEKGTICLNDDSWKNNGIPSLSAIAPRTTTSDIDMKRPSEEIKEPRQNKHQEERLQSKKKHKDKKNMKKRSKRDVDIFEEFMPEQKKPPPPPQALSIEEAIKKEAQNVPEHLKHLACLLE